MRGRVFEALLFLAIFSVAAHGLRCWSCENTDLLNCKRKGKTEYCDDMNEKVCQTEVRISDGKPLIVKTGCKQSHACFNNHQQNPAGAWMPSQCNHGVENSVCRCCCEGNKCNKKREMLLCKFPEQKLGDAPITTPSLILEKTCGEYPETPINGKRNCIGGYAMRAFCKFECDEGYRLNGYSMTICVQRGKGLSWNRDAPTCDKIDVCKRMPRQPTNGHSECNGHGELGTVCGFACDFGYVLEGAQTATCIRTETGATWSDGFPMCKPTCKYVPTTPDNGSKKCRGGTSIGSVCAFNCQPGYEISGFPKTTCVKNGDSATWNYPSPTCEPVCRQFPRSPQNGEKSCIGDGHVGTACVFACSSGHRMNGAASTTCEATEGGARWSHKTPTCEPICDPWPKSPLYGGMKCDGTGEVGTTCSFQCNAGTRMTGKKATTCMEKDSKADWSNEAPICEPVCVPVPNTPVHGKISCSGVEKVGAKCTFVCDTGYQLNGALETLCQKISPGLARWSKLPPTCIPVCDPLPLAPQYGDVLCGGGGEVGTLCSFTCRNGYELKGSLKTSCVETDYGANWTNAVPKCEPTPTCDAAPQSPENGQVWCDGAGELGTVCQFACDAEFELKGREITTCLRSGDRALWSNEAPFCKAVIVEPVCPPFGDFPNGKIVCDNTVNREGTICRFECLDVGYELVPSERIETRCSAEPDLKWTVQKPCCVECSKAKKDIMIAMDSSGSIDPKEWKTMTTFVQNIVRNFNVSEETVQFSIFQFSSGAKSDGLMYFGRYNKKQLIKQIGRMRRMASGTMTGKALQYAQRRFRDPGNRKDVSDMLWVVTDGATEDMKDMQKFAKKIRRDGIEIMALAIGPTDGFVEQMEKLTGDPQKILMAEDMTSLSDELVQRVAVKICEDSCTSRARLYTQ